MLPRIQHDLGLSHGQAGLLGAIPVFCLGLFAFPVPWLLARIGSRAALAAALGIVAVAGFARAGVPGAAAVLLLTVPFGVAAGVGGAVLPVVVKERFAEQPALATGVYSIGINVGAAGAAAIAAPLARLLGWRGALALLALVGVLCTLAWLALSARRLPPRERDFAQPPLPLRSSVAWLLALVFGLQATCFHGLSLWLADAYVEHGWSSARAGALAATLQFASVPGTLAIMWAGDRLRSRRSALLAASALLAGSIAGLIVAPTAAWSFAVLGGLACGALFPLALTLSIDVVSRPEEAGAVAGLMLGVGYTIAALAPLLIGVVRDAAGGFALPLWLLVGVAATLFVVCLPLTRERLSRAPAQE